MRLPIQDIYCRYNKNKNHFLSTFATMILLDFLRSVRLPVHVAGGGAPSWILFPSDVLCSEMK